MATENTKLKKSFDSAQDPRPIRQAQDLRPKAKSEKPKANGLVVAKVVRTILANERAASAKTKKRGEVSGGGKKPWRQKGTGRARVGSNRSPIWRGGGIVFGPTGNQNFQLKTNRKEREIAKKEAMDDKKSLTKTLSAPTLTKTKQAAKFLTESDLKGNVLILAKKETEVAKIKKYFKNIPNVIVHEQGNENAYEVMNADTIVILESSALNKTGKPASSKTEKKAKLTENKDALRPIRQAQVGEQVEPQAQAIGSEAQARRGGASTRGMK